MLGRGGNEPGLGSFTGALVGVQTVGERWKKLYPRVSSGCLAGLAAERWGARGGGLQGAGSPHSNHPIWGRWAPSECEHRRWHSLWAAVFPQVITCQGGSDAEAKKWCPHEAGDQIPLTAYPTLVLMWGRGPEAFE